MLAIMHSLETAVWPWIASGEFRPVIDGRFSFENAADAHRRLEASAHVGKIVFCQLEAGHLSDKKPASVARFPAIEQGGQNGRFSGSFSSPMSAGVVFPLIHPASGSRKSAGQGAGRPLSSHHPVSLPAARICWSFFSGACDEVPERGRIVHG